MENNGLYSQQVTLLRVHGLVKNSKTKDIVSRMEVEILDQVQLMITVADVVVAKEQQMEKEKENPTPVKMMETMETMETMRIQEHVQMETPFNVSTKWN